MAGALPLASATNNGLQSTSGFKQDMSSVDMRNYSMLKILEHENRYNEFDPFFICISRKGVFFYIAGYMNDSAENMVYRIVQVGNEDVSYITFYKKVEGNKSCLYIHCNQDNNSPQRIYLCRKNQIGDIIKPVQDLSGYTEVSIYTAIP